MIDKVKPQDCSLCGSCINACPVNAITYSNRYLDFSYPLIDNKICIKCGLCERVCPILDAGVGVQKGWSPKAYIGRTTDAAIRKNSSSGGIFWALADMVLQCDGYVCGAVFDDKFNVHHIISNKYETVKRMLGSKYAQSDTTNVFSQIKQLLTQGEYVLFTGCPCQVAGLKSYLGKEYAKLITVDVVCHGIPSATMLQAYISYQEAHHKSKINAISFRDKTRGWHRSSVKLTFNNNTVYNKPIGVDAYMKGFLSGVFLKESCYQCQFKNFTSGSDLTIGDFWGAEAVCPELDDNTGLSAIVVNTSKGAEVLIQLNCEFWQGSLDAIIKYNMNLVQPTSMNEKREEFYRFANVNGYAAAIKQYFEEHPIAMLRRTIKYAARCFWYKIRGRKKPIY